MLLPGDLNLPYPGWRPYQLDAITRIAASRKKLVILEAPAGLGKTGIAVGAARVMGIRAVYLTHTKQLQSQYEKIDGVARVIGRDNFPCYIEPEVTAALGICTLGQVCQYAGMTGEHGACQYYDQRRLAMQSREVVMNYAYALRTLPGWRRPGLLVCDEAHALRQQLEGYAGGSLSRLGLRRVAEIVPEIEEAPTGKGSRVKDWQEWAAGVKTPISDALDKLEDDLANSGLAGRRAARTVQRVLEVVKGLGSHDEWVMSGFGAGWDFKPVWLDTEFDERLDRWADKVVLMSATILDPKMFLESLGLGSQVEFDWFQYPSPFPKARRPMRYWPVTRVSRGADMGAIVGAVDAILEAHQHEKGIIHTVSYSLADLIAGSSQYKERLIRHGTGTREEALWGFEASDPDEGKVLISPSMGVGVDLPYVNCRFQIICKLPFPDQSDPQRIEQGKVKLGKAMAIYDTACSLVQTYGRAMRAEDDYGVTYLLDRNWEWFRGAAKNLLPGWFREAVETEFQIGLIGGISMN